MDDVSELRCLDIGSWEMLKEGSDVALVATGSGMLELAEAAAAQLATSGISAAIVNARFIKPLDEAMLDMLADRRVPIVTMEEGAVLGGFGSAVLEYYAERGFGDVAIRCMGVPDVFIEHGSIKDQQAESGLTIEAVANAVQSLVPRKKQRA